MPSFKDALETEVPAGHGLIARIDETGDTKIVFDRSNEAEVNFAREAFLKARKDGFMAYKVQGEGSRGEVMHKFDRDAERIILAPAMKGG